MAWQYIGISVMPLSSKCVYYPRVNVILEQTNDATPLSGFHSDCWLMKELPLEFG